jgi:DNA helicase HerA-like ATPase
MSPAGAIAAEYHVAAGQGVELGSVVVDGKVDPMAQIRIPLGMMRRHGLVTGATGTGTTKTLQVIAEQLSAAGVPVVMADFKSDLSGLSRPGEVNGNIEVRSRDTGDQWSAAAFPVEFMSVGAGGIGVPTRATISAFGPILLSKVLGLNRGQESTLRVIFSHADQQGIPLIQLEDLRKLIAFLARTDRGRTQLRAMGGDGQTAGILVALNTFDLQGGDRYFGESELDPGDLIRIDDRGRGVISLFGLGDWAVCPVMFSAFMMWVLAELCAALPEAGQTDKPQLVFVFDEAHRLFKEASKEFLRLVEATLNRAQSKGVGVIFCTQLPDEIPRTVIAHLGIRIQHALRIFTRHHQKALARVVRTYPRTDVYDLERDLTALGIGEAMVTVLPERGAPMPVAWTRLRSPRSLMASVGTDYIRTAAQASPLFRKYGGK